MAPTIPESSPVGFVLLGVSLIGLYIVGTVFYRVFLHPLRSFPGPILWRMTILPRVYYTGRGELAFKTAELFKKYNTSILRISPNELLFNDPQAWKDIYGHRTTGAPELPKHPDFYRVFPDIPASVIDAGREEHQHMRRLLSHGFSDKSMREQEPIIGSYVDLLIQRIYENSKNGTVALDMRNWYNWTTFDVIGDLGFGSAFGLLRDSAYHPWVRIITHAIKETTMLQIIIRLGFKPVVNWARRSGLMSKNDQHMDLVKSKLQQRINLGVERPDFIEGLIRKKGDWHLSFDQVASNASLLLVAGSETTATLLSGATFLLTTHPEQLAKLTKEVRSSFTSEDQITLTSVGNLHYMLAVLNECFRRYPPVTGDLPRLVPKGGVTILGQHVAEGTTVQVYQWPINHDERWWKDPFEFVPERWMGDPKYKDDKLDAMQPFSVGPRNCIGRNLAYAEMRLILAKIIYNFDMTLADDCKDWLRTQKAYVVWDKPPLNIYMTPVAKKSD
ncbi:cytochrome P450 [Hypoxylon rubiginosum]|uniref:Cytochrome P450 n=1 Tax=Hypoxylon rubiginosum TaxID=110542 RepID=A0ACC0DCH8_9PEZI|nr:cytochrome P450 [Hypoxylon rubiginosum]